MSAALETPPLATVPTPSMDTPPVGAQDHPGDQGILATHISNVSGVPNLLPGQQAFDTQGRCAGQDSSNLSDHDHDDTQARDVTEVPTSPPGQRADATHSNAAGRGAILDDPFLGALAAIVDDMERTRLALQNRYRHLTRSKVDKDEKRRGLGLPQDDPQVILTRQLLVQMGGEGSTKIQPSADGKAPRPSVSAGSAEFMAVEGLKDIVQQHPLWIHWAADKKGIGEKSFARLLSAIGDPYWNSTSNIPRKVSNLWSYAGFHVIDGQAPRKRRGQQVNWSPNAHMRTYLITQSCLMQKGAYYDVFKEAQGKYSDAIHKHPCAQCGTKKKGPAPANSPLNGKHKQACAMRFTSKRILRDLWRAARDIHVADQQISLPASALPSPRVRPRAGD